MQRLPVLAKVTACFLKAARLQCGFLGVEILVGNLAQRHIYASARLILFSLGVFTNCRAGKDVLGGLAGLIRIELLLCADLHTALLGADAVLNDPHP